MRILYSIIFKKSQLVKKFILVSLNDLSANAISEVKVTVTQGWYVSLPHPKMHVHTKFGILTSNDRRYMLWKQLF